jgi:hypothetical protein
MKDDSDHTLYVEGLHYTPAGAVKDSGKYACDIREHFASYLQSSVGEVPQPYSTIHLKNPPLYSK